MRKNQTMDVGKREEGMKREAAFDKKYDRIVNNAHITPEKMIWYPGFFDMLDFFEKSYNKNYAFYGFTLLYTQKRLMMQTCLQVGEKNLH